MKNFSTSLSRVCKGLQSPFAFFLLPRKKDAVCSARVCVGKADQGAQYGVLRTLFLPTALALSALVGCNSTPRPLSHADSVTIAKAIVTKHIDSIKKVRVMAVDSTTKGGGIDRACTSCLTELVKSSDAFKVAATKCNCAVDITVDKMANAATFKRANGITISNGYTVVVLGKVGDLWPELGYFVYDMESKQLYQLDQKENVCRMLYTYSGVMASKVNEACK